MMVHIADAANTYNSIFIRTVDSDVVVLAVYAFGQLISSLNELWVVFDSGKHYPLIPTHKIYVLQSAETSALHFLCSIRSLDVTRFLVLLEDVSELYGIYGTCRPIQQ